MQVAQPKDRDRGDPCRLLGGIGLAAVWRVRTNVETLSTRLEREQHQQLLADSFQFSLR